MKSSLVEKLISVIIVPAIVAVAVFAAINLRSGADSKPGTVRTAAGASNTPSKGTVPPDARGADGRMDITKVPDYIVAYDRAGNVAGYVRRQDLFGTDGNGKPAVTMQVFSDDLQTVVGQMVENRGFVPNGTNPEDVKPFPQVEVASTTTTVGK